MITSDWQQQQTNKWISEKKHLSAVNKCCYCNCDFLINNENCCEGQHKLAGISNAAAVKNRVYFWQGVVALCESFPNVNRALVKV